MAIDPKLLNDGEDVVVSTRTHAKALILPGLALVLSLVAAVTATLLLGAGLAGTILTWLAWLVAAAVIVWFSVVPAIRWWTTSYTVTTRRFIMRTGFVSREGRTIPLNRISGVDFEVGVIDRIFGCGTLVVNDASASGMVRVHDIPEVEKVQLAIAEQLHNLSGQPRSDDGN